MLVSGIVLCSFNNLIYADDLNKNSTTINDKNSEQKQAAGNLLCGNRLSDQILSEKEEGWSPIIIPILNYKTKHGVGFGFNGGATYNGQKDDQYFCYAPYVYEITALIYHTLKGEQDYSFNCDMPYFLNSPIEIMTSFEYDKLGDASYFGIGPEASKYLVTRYGARYRSYNRYNRHFLVAYDPMNPISPLYKKKINDKYNEYIYNMLMGNVAGVINIAKYIKISAAFNLKKVHVSSWAGEEFDTMKEQNVTSSLTLIDLDPAVINQKRQGYINSIRFGIGFDTRDYAPDPRNGAFLDYTINFYSKYLGSDFNFIRSTACARYYYSPVWQLTFATRIAYTTVTGKVPFYELGIFSFLMEDQPGLGNDSTLRGYQYNRFIGHTMTVGNLEVRWEFIKFKLFQQNFAFKIIGFVDAGSVFKKSFDFLTKWNNYHIGYGPGLAIVYNLSTIIHYYLGFSSEDMTMSFDFNHAF